LTIILGVTLALTLLLISFGAVRLATIRSELTNERGTMSVLLTRGLASAVLARTIGQRQPTRTESLFPFRGQNFLLLPKNITFCTLESVKKLTVSLISCKVPLSSLRPRERAGRPACFVSGLLMLSRFESSQGSCAMCA